MEKVFLLEIVTPHGLVVSANVKEAYIPGSQGDFGVLPGHFPFLTSLRRGAMHYLLDDKMRFLALEEGFAEVTATRTTILTDQAEPAEEIDAEKARADKSLAEEQLKTVAREDPSYKKIAENLERANLRIRVAQKAIR